MDKIAQKLLNERNKERERQAYLKGKAAIWKDLKEHNDIKTLAAMHQVSRTAISNAINKGIGSVDLLTKVEQYFKPREPKTNTDEPAASA